MDDLNQDPNTRGEEDRAISDLHIYILDNRED
jgi:hypothetical protein